MYRATPKSPNTSIHTRFIHSIHCSCVHHGTESNTRGARMAKTGLCLILLKGWGEARDMGVGGLCTFDTLTSSCPSFLYIPRNNFSTSLSSSLNLLWTPDPLLKEFSALCPLTCPSWSWVGAVGTLAPSCQQDLLSDNLMSWAELLLTAPTLEVGQLKTGVSWDPFTLRSTLEAADPCSGPRACQILVLPSSDSGSFGQVFGVSLPEFPYLKAGWRRLTVIICGVVRVMLAAN